jgi:hypothetical protein
VGPVGPATVESAPVGPVSPFRAKSVQNAGDVSGWWPELEALRLRYEEPPKKTESSRLYVAPAL